MRMFRKSRSLAAVFSAALVLSSLGLAQASALPRTSALKLVHPGFLTVGSDTTYPPMESRNGSGQFVGADVDLAQALAKAMGLKGAKIVDNSFDSIIPAMTSRHAFDVIMSSMNDTPERRKQISFVDYMQASEGIVVKASSKTHASNYAGVCGLTVAVETGTTEQAGLQQANNSCKKKINIKNFTKDTDAFEAFASGHADAYTGDYPVASLYVKSHAGSLRLAGKPFATGQDYGIGYPKNNGALGSALKKALNKIRANGQYHRDLSKWGVAGAALR